MKLLKEVKRLSNVTLSLFVVIWKATSLLFCFHLNSLQQTNYHQGLTFSCICQTWSVLLMIVARDHCVLRVVWPKLWRKAAFCQRASSYQVKVKKYFFGTFWLTRKSAAFGRVLPSIRQARIRSGRLSSH